MPRVAFLFCLCRVQAYERFLLFNVYIRVCKVFIYIITYSKSLDFWRQFVVKCYMDKFGANPRFGGCMYKKTISALYVMNIAFQSIFTLGWQIALGFGIGYVAVTFWGAPQWIYVPLILAGVATGFVSMIRFLLGAMKSLDSLEAQHKSDKRKKAASHTGQREDQNSNK